MPLIINFTIMHTLIEGCLEAIKNWPSNKGWSNVFCTEWDKQYTEKLYVVLEHYKNWGTIFNRP